MWVIFALAGALLAAIAVVLSKAGVKDTDSSLAFAIQSILILIISWIAALLQKQTSGIANIDKRTWIFLFVPVWLPVFPPFLLFVHLNWGRLR